MMTMVVTVAVICHERMFSRLAAVWPLLLAALRLGWSGAPAVEVHGRQVAAESLCWGEAEADVARIALAPSNHCGPRLWWPHDGAGASLSGT